MAGVIARHTGKSPRNRGLGQGGEQHGEIVGAQQGLNDTKRNGYGGPCPPSGTHRYFFKIYALDTTLTLTPLASKADLERAMQGHVLAVGQLMGIYKR